MGWHMATTLDIVEAAFRKLGIKAEDESLSADMQANGVATLSRMLARWRLRGMAMAHGALSADTPFPLGEEYEAGAIALLAAQLAPDYSVGLTFDPEPYEREISAGLFVMPELSMPGHYLNLASQRRSYR